MRLHRRKCRWGWCWGLLAWGIPRTGVAGSLDRLRSVSDHARRQGHGGPDHLWMGLGLLAVFLLAVVLAAWWTTSRRRP